MSQHLYRRCGCRDENGHQLARSCPRLDSDPKHGSWAYYYSNGSDPRTKKRRQYAKAGFPTKKAADAALTELKHQLEPAPTSSPRTRRWRSTPRRSWPGGSPPGQVSSPPRPPPISATSNRTLSRPGSGRCC